VKLCINSYRLFDPNEESKENYLLKRNNLRVCTLTPDIERIRKARSALPLSTGEGIKRRGTGRENNQQDLYFTDKIESFS
jgi:hypothetical protein